MKFSKVQLATAAVAAFGALLAAPAHAGKTLDAIKAAGRSPAASTPAWLVLQQPTRPANGPVWTSTSASALAAATLGDAEKVKYVPLNAQQRFTRCSPAKSMCWPATPRSR
jgi:general L-amino acid transport system substrate-binding protein